MKKVFVNSLPKSGTNLVSKFLKLIGYKYANLGLASSLILGRYFFIRQLIRGVLFTKNPIVIGLDIPYSIRAEWLEKKLEKLETGMYITGHARYSDNLYMLLKKHNLKIIQVIRDPRDVLVSYVHYISNNPSHFLYKCLRKMNYKEKYEFLLYGGKCNGLYIESFRTILLNIDLWISKNDIFIIKFEDIIGSKGGGNDNKQLSIAKQILDFLEIKSDISKLKFVLDNLFGGTHTFRKGKIGSWKEEMPKDIVDKLLKETKDIIKKWEYE